MNDIPPATPPADGCVPLLSVIVINYNGSPWLERCLVSLCDQTIADQIEIIVADNASTDQSDQLAAQLLRDWPRGRVCHHGTNLGYSEGNNRAARDARGRYLFFLNNDTWLEPGCLECLVREIQATGSAAGAPLVMDYLDDVMQSAGAGGFDFFGLLSPQRGSFNCREVFVASGCSLLVETGWFRKLGGFDPEFFMYADEYDLCWRLWLAGGRVILAPSARLHHRGAAAVNPKGGGRMVELRTSDTKRYYANRNNLLTVLKNGQHLLLALVPLQLALLAAEALVMAAWTGRWTHVRRAYVAALRDCWRLRRHVLAERRRLRIVRRRGDLWMLRFLRGRLNRWEEIRRFRRFGPLRVDSQ